MAKQQKRHVGRYANSMLRHIHMHNKPTYFNIAHVEKIESPTKNRH